MVLGRVLLVVMVFIMSFFCSGLLESLCFTLYDVLRPIIIKINHLETLADLCSILNVRHCLCIYMFLCVLCVCMCVIIKYILQVEMLEEQVKPKGTKHTHTHTRTHTHTHYTMHN